MTTVHTNSADIELRSPATAADQQTIVSPDIEKRAQEISEQRQYARNAWLDRLFAYLMLAQWGAGILVAVFISPRTWAGSEYSLHIHVAAAVVLGGIITSLPVILAFRIPGRRNTRFVIAAAQAMTSALLIHLSGGRIETHFHVFGSLALLACYRDIRVLVIATLITTFDHWIRGVWWPESVYGVVSNSTWRFLEHAGWVVFEVVFLATAIRRGNIESAENSRNMAILETTKWQIEAEVERQTKSLQTAMRQSEEANRQLEELVDRLEEKNRELDEFTYVASHDLQEPIRKLVSFSKLLEQDIDSDLNEEAKRDLHFIVDAAHRMRDLVQDLLALSRTGRSAMKQELVDLNECVDDVLGVLDIALQESGAEIIRDDLPTVSADRTLIKQLYQNLIGNAIKFVKDKTPIIHLTAERKDEMWELGVKDNGIGIRPEHAERIFQPFQRLHKRNEYEGTGIGLAICKKAVQRHGGQIYVESVPGEGTHFKFTLYGSEHNGDSECEPQNRENELLSC